MHTWVYQLAILWHIGLVAVLVGSALRTPRLVDRLVALDSLALVFVAALALIALHRHSPHDLDIALVLALLGFAQTVATARVLERRKDLR
jgi:multisubunit Na+/H+ antiporter MnhF subunit